MTSSSIYSISPFRAPSVSRVNPSRPSLQRVAQPLPDTYQPWNPSKPTQNMSVQTISQSDFEGSLIGSGYYRTDQLEMMIRLDKEGRLYQKHGDSFFPLGYLNAQGEYHFLTGQHGNIYKGGPFQMYADTLRGKLGMALRLKEQDIAVRSSEIPMIRQYLTNQGIDGRGVKVTIVERSVPDYDGKLEVGEHAKTVKALIDDPTWGRAPGATTSFKILPSYLSKEIVKVEDTLESLDAYIYKFMIDPSVTSYLKELISRPLPTDRVLNFSNGSTFQAMGTQLMLILRDRDDDDAFKHPKLAQLILGHLPPTELTADNEVLEYQRVVDFIKNRYILSSQTQDILETYQKLTQTLANRGVHIVVSMANSHDALPPRVTTPPEYGINLLGMSPDVIRVAASNNHQTPYDLNDDTITGFSSRGNGTWNPTLAATGENVWLDRYYYAASENGVFTGTSASAPNVSATIALMLQVNPHLTVQQTLDILQQTAVKTTGDTTAEGAGMMDTIAAVRLAQQRKAPPSFRQIVLATENPFQQKIRA